VAAPVRSPASKAGEPGSCAGDASLYASASGAAAMWSPGGATLPLLRFQARLRRTAGIFAVLRSCPRAVLRWTRRPAPPPLCGFSYWQTLF